MALVNSAVDLASRGKKVLAVDFDLEAPGLDTFPMLRDKGNTSGLVDFVLEYQVENRAPDVRNFIYSVPNIPNLSVMPSGNPKGDYSTRSRNINWESLYAEKDGYLLFEDLKAQWQEYLEPDYVFIDSRTGYTDTGGICTRQLPDSVTILFFPNEQNLRGLSRVVEDIRREAKSPIDKTIDLKFVMSNVPDLDDEDEVLSQIKDRFMKGLKLREEPLLIHRYESLSLLNQAIFVKERPNSRLAKEYREVANRIVDGNLFDRDGALHYIESMLDSYSPSYLVRRLQFSDDDLRDVEDTIRTIEEAHWSDDEVITSLAELQFRQDRLDESLSLLDRAIDELHTKDISAYALRARARSMVENADGASEDALKVLLQGKVGLSQVVEMCRYLRNVDDATIKSLPAIVNSRPKSRIQMASMLSTRRQNHFARLILQQVLSDEDCPEEDQQQAKTDLCLSYLHTRNFKKAVAHFESEQKPVNEMTMQDAFNYGVALWGDSKEIDSEPFRRVVELFESEENHEISANRLQCLALASWIIGEKQNAKSYVERAGQRIKSDRNQYSYWRYERVSSRVFKRDLDELEEMLRGNETVKPRFLSDPRIGLFKR